MKKIKPIYSLYYRSSTSLVRSYRSTTLKSNDEPFLSFESFETPTPEVTNDATPMFRRVNLNDLDPSFESLLSVNPKMCGVQLDDSSLVVLVPVVPYSNVSSESMAKVVNALRPSACILDVPFDHHPFKSNPVTSYRRFPSLFSVILREFLSSPSLLFSPITRTLFLDSLMDAQCRGLSSTYAHYRDVFDDARYPGFAPFSLEKRFIQTSFSQMRHAPLSRPHARALAFLYGSVEETHALDSSQIALGLLDSSDAHELLNTLTTLGDSLLLSEHDDALFELPNEFVDKRAELFAYTIRRCLSEYPSSTIVATIPYELFDTTFSYLESNFESELIRRLFDDAVLKQA